ncbi:MAG: hypothetical protein WAS21_19425 [Geminicoccaceae bacterium]
MPYHPDRIVGAAEWAKLPPDVQPRIGAVANDARDADTPATRAFEAADPHGSDQLLEAVSKAVSAIDPDQPLLPAGLGEGCPWSGPGPDSAARDEPAASGIPWMV